MLRKSKFLFVVCGIAAVLFAAPQAHAATEFQMAAQVLAAARAGNIQQVQTLVNSGANVNYVDATGLSIVCTALMNNDIRAAQILQMYGADASRCDQQIRRYNQRLPRNESGGLFSGLSTAQNLTLAAAGAAAVIGAVWLLSDVFAPQRTIGGSGTGGGGGGNQGCNGGPPCASGLVCCPGIGCRTHCGTGSGIEWQLSNIPCGPAGAVGGWCNRNVNTGFITEDQVAFRDAQNFYSSSTAGGTVREDFEWLSMALLDPARITNPGGTPEEQVQEMFVMRMQNYLLLMNGYASMARGYLGMTTLRGLTAPFAPLNVSGTTINGFPPGGGRPVMVALISENGVNTLASSPLAGLPGNSDATPTGGGSSIEDGWLYWAEQTGSDTWASNLSTISRRFYNNKWTDSSSFENMDTTLYEDDRFDLSGNGTAIENLDATEYDNMLAKIIIGGSANGATPGSGGRGDADYTGFLPNGQLVVFRTGGISPTGNYQNFAAMLSAIDRQQTLGLQTGPGGLVPTTLANRVNVIANAAPVHSMYAHDAWTVSDYLSFANLPTSRAIFVNLINNCYGGDCRMANPNGIDVAIDVDDFFTLIAGGIANTYGNNQRLLYRPLVIFSTGGYLIGSFDDLANSAVFPGAVLDATIENAAPLEYTGLNQFFMSAVAVQLNDVGTLNSNGTQLSNITDWNQGNQRIVLSTWADPYDTSGNPNIYGARKCGWAGVGNSDVDPWCFAAAGQTDMMAVASLAGAAGAMQSAFGSYMTNDQIFVLMALTSDGRQMTPNQLNAKYQLPPEIQARFPDINNLDLNSAQWSSLYMAAFAEVFGYGLVNLALATQPGAYIYYFGTHGTTGGRDIIAINSLNGNAFWWPNVLANPGPSGFGPGASNPVRNATLLSGAFGTRNASINIPMFDFIESVDGTMSMPRIFDGSVSLASGRRSMHMGDTLGDFQIENRQVQSESDGLVVGMSFRDTPRDDGFSNLDKLSIGFNSGAMSFGAKFERNAGDTNILRGDNANPIMAIASNMMSTDASYAFGNWRFGARAASGMVTEEGLLSHDPMLDGTTNLLKLGDVAAFESGVTYSRGAMSFGANVGTLRESDTTLGAFSDGLVSMDGGNTVYFDNVLEYRVRENLRFNARYTTARTTTDSMGAHTIIANITDLYSDAASIGMEFGGWSFALARPLAVTRGAMQYFTADLELVAVDHGFDLAATSYIDSLDLSPDRRELRASLAYRTKLGEHTSGAVGFVYRNNPNHTNEFGNEALLMLKLNHRLGI
jgi:hypothetical protein